MTKRNSTTETKRVCRKCDSNTTYILRRKRKDGSVSSYPTWIKGMCKNCYNKYDIGPRRTHTRYWFKGHDHYSKKLARIGVCNWCRGVVGQINAITGLLCKRTSMAHMEYHDDDTLKDTIELCDTCHTKYDRMTHNYFKKKKR